MEHRYSPSGMSLETAEEVAEILQERLASLIDLALILKHVHWNVVGVGFVAVHELMDTQTASVRSMIDETAERIATLGGVAGGLAGLVADMREADEDYALGRAPVMAHLGALDKVYAAVGAAQRDAIASVAELDPVSEDLLIGHARQLEMNHWFVRAHVSDVDGYLVTAGAEDQLEAASTAAFEMQPGVAEGSNGDEETTAG